MNFEEQVLDGIKTVGTKADAATAAAKAVESKQDILVQNYNQLDRDTKKAFEELTALKKNANAAAEAEQKVNKVLTQLRWEQRQAFGDPIKRIQNDPELRARLNIAIRRAVDLQGDMMAVTTPMAKALGEDSSPGSTLINTQLANEIYDTLAMYGIWNSFAVRRVGTKTTSFPVKTVRPVAGFVMTEGSGQLSDDSNKAGTAVSCVVQMIGVLLNVSKQLLEDSEFDVTADVLDDFAEAFAYRLDWACLQADGGNDSTDGLCTGIFGGGGTAAAAASGNTTVETTDLEDWTKCLLTVDPIVLNRQSRWWMHPQILVRALSVKDQNGRPIFLTATEAPTRGGIGSILGYPVTPAFAAPTANTTSSKVAVFGDPNAMVVGLRTDFTFEASDHHLWDYLSRSFRAYGRAGTKIRRALGFAVLTLASS